MNLNIDNNETKINNLKDFLSNNKTNLTSFLKKDDIKSLLNDFISYPTINETIKLLRDRKIYGYEAIIGTSYDYCLRFLLSYQETKKIDNALFDSLGFQLANNKKELLKEYSTYQDTNKLLGIVILSFKLSIFETEFRSGVKLNFKNYSKETLDNIYNEIIKLMKVSFEEIKRTKDAKIEYNPIFAHKNILADGDIIINKTLVDFKAVSSLNNFKDHINQLIMYFALNEIKGRYKQEIDSIKLYYPRYNIYPEYKIKNIINQNNMNILKDIVKQ